MYLFIQLYSTYRFNFAFLPIDLYAYTMITHNDKFKFLEIPRVTMESGERYYVCPKYGTALPSATTILSKFSDKKQMLIEWERAVGSKKADQIRTEAATLGSLVHTNVEKHIAGETRPGGSHFLRKQAYIMADQIIEKALPDIDEFYGMEVALAFPGLYAGTCDLIANFKGHMTICDHKSARKMRERSSISDYFLQLVAYGAAFNETHGTNINHGVIFMVSRDLKFETFELLPHEWKIRTEEFFDKVERYYESFIPPDLSVMNVKYQG